MTLPSRNRLFVTLPALGWLLGCSAVPSAIDGAASSTGAGQTPAERALAGKVAGEPVNCISATFADRPFATADGAVVYRVGSDLAYRQDFNGTCPNFANKGYYTVRSSPLPLLCSGEIVQLVDSASGFPVGPCTYGPFVPYRRP